MLIPSPWVEENFEASLLECSETAYLECFSFTIVKKIRYSNLMNALKWLFWTSFTFTVVEETFEIIKFFDAIKKLIWGAYTFTMVKENFEVLLLECFKTACLELFCFHHG